MKEKIEELPWRSVKIEPGTQKTFDAASHAVFINSQHSLGRSGCISPRG